MRSSQIIKDVAALLPEGVTTHVGAAHLAREEAPPRVVWVPTSSGYGPPARADTTGNSSVAQKPIATRYATYAVHVWGAASETDGGTTIDGETASLDAAEVLAEQLIRAVRKVALGNYELEPDSPIDQDVASLGQVIIVPIKLHIPVTADATGTVTLLGAVGSGEMDFPLSTTGPSTPPP